MRKRDRGAGALPAGRLPPVLCRQPPAGEHLREKAIDDDAAAAVCASRARLARRRLESAVRNVHIRVIALCLFRGSPRTRT